MPAKTTAIQALQFILDESWSQFSWNLSKFRRTRESEFLHQARIGWRRFKSSLKFFKPLLAAEGSSAVASLRPLIDLMGDVRDLDVALEVTLPAWRDLYTQEKPNRIVQWDALIQELAGHRKQACRAIDLQSRQANIQSSMRRVRVWIAKLAVHPKANVTHLSGKAWRHWIERRLKRLQRKLDHWRRTHHPGQQHKARLLAKQLRYEVEILEPYLSKRWVKQPLRQARRLQLNIGLRRDRIRAYQLVDARLDYPAVAQFINAKLGAASDYANMGGGIRRRDAFS
jgi:CHAD domain-containing protein